jgi:hypothetical protein
MNEQKLGKLITGEAQRDAIHVAIAPVIAGGKLEPGWNVGLNEKGEAVNFIILGIQPIGIVDPFLTRPVKPGEQFWLVLYPGTITSLRHDWSHPAFKDDASAITEQVPARPLQESIAWLRSFASEWNMDYDEMITNAVSGAGLVADGTSIHSWSEIEDGGQEFWHHLSIVTGKYFSDEHKENTYFSCSC